MLGKRIFVTVGAPESTPDQLETFLAQFNLAFLLRRLGELAEAEFRNDEGPTLFSVNALTHLGEVAIRVGSDLNERIPDFKDIEKAVLLFHGLPEPNDRQGEDGGALEILLRIGNSQFVQPLLEHLLVRSWMIYERLWRTTPNARDFDIDGAVQELTGSSYPRLIPTSLAYSGNGRKGYSMPYPSGSQSNFPEQFRLTETQERRLLDWMTATYSEIRTLGAKAPSAGKYALSPFLEKPMVRPDIVPDGADPEVRLVPLPAYVWRKVTAGLYHALATRWNKGAGSNPFRVAFGYVFEAYVGELLRQGSGSALVIPEFDYGTRAKPKKSPDWMVLDGSSLVVIEAKQSALTLETKIQGDLESARRDLKRTLTKGTHQLLEFRRDVLEGRTGKPELDGVKDLEMLLVTHDDIPFGNFLLRPLIKDEVENASEVHLACIEELERLQEHCWGQSPFQLLRGKWTDRQTAAQDLGSWISESLGKPTQPHPYLRSTFDELMASFGVPRSTPAD